MGKNTDPDFLEARVLPQTHTHTHTHTQYYVGTTPGLAQLLRLRTTKDGD